MSYSEVQKSLAVEIIARHGGEVSAVALAEVRQILDAPDLPKVTVWRWLQANVTSRKNAAPEVQEKARLALDDIFEETARKYLEHAQGGSVIAKTSGTSAVIAAATAVDKMRLLRGLPTEIVAIIPELVAAFTANGWNATEMFNDMLSKANAHREANRVDA